MKKIGIFLDEIKDRSISTTEKFQKVGSNTGNLLFWHSLKETLNLDIKSRWYIDHPEDLDLDEYKAFITTDLIWICQGVDFSYLNGILDFLGDLPLIPISIGLQERNFDPDFKLHPETVKVLKRISERCVIGVRGYYTADILTKYGITNFEVIGCPSMYMPDVDFEKINNTPKKLEKITVNFETFYGELDMHKTDFLNYCAERDFSFVEQTQTRLSEDNISDNKALSKVQGWIDTQGNCFFDIEEWRGYVREFDFSLGMRFHGNVIALWEGVPALFVTCDSRTKELCEFYSLPNVDITEFDTDKPVEYYYGLANYAKFRKKYLENLKKWEDFLKMNSLLVADSAAEVKKKVLYHVSHAGSLPLVLIHCLTVNHDKETYLLTGTDKELMGEILDKLHEFVDCGIFKQVLKCNFLVGWDTPDIETCERKIVEHFDKVFSDANLNISDFDEIYSSCDTLHSFAVYASMKHRHYHFMAIAPNFFLNARSRVEEFGKNPGRKPYADTMIKHGAADGIGEYAIRMLYPESQNSIKENNKYIVFDYQAMLYKISDFDKANILKIYGKPDIISNEPVTLFLTDSQWIMRTLPDVREQAIIMYQLLADYYIPEKSNIVIKPHPLSRATTEDFIKYFEVPVFSKTFPSNFLGLVNNLEISKIYTTSESSSTNPTICNNIFFIGGYFVYNYSMVKKMHYSLSLFYHLKNIFTNMVLFNYEFHLEFVYKMCEISFNAAEHIQNLSCSNMVDDMCAIINLGAATRKGTIGQIVEAINNVNRHFTLLFLTQGEERLPFDKIKEERYSNFFRIELNKLKRKKNVLDTLESETLYIYSSDVKIHNNILEFNYQKTNKYLGIDIISKCYDTYSTKQDILLSLLRNKVQEITSRNEILENLFQKQQGELNLIKELLMKGGC